MRRILALFNENRLLAYLLPIIAIPLVTTGLFFLREQIEFATVALLFFLPVAACAVLGGLGPGILSASIAFFALKFFFIPPYGTLKVHKTQDLASLVIFLILAILISQLVGRLMKSLATSRAREVQNTRLYELSQELAVSTTEPDILNKLAEYVLTAFKADQVEIFIQMKAGTFSVCLPENLADPTQPKVKPTLSMPLQGSHHLDGEIRLWRINRPIKPYGEKLLNMYTQQGIQALERKSIAEQVRQTELLQATEKLQSSLLNSISHDLRTPLVSITGALSSLQEKSLVLDQTARDSLLVTALRDAERLNRLVGNLLNMTRLEADAMPLYKEPCDWEDIIGSAIEQLGDRAANREILVNIPNDTTLIPLDIGLFEQVFVNVLDNAVKYSLPDSAIEIHVKEEPGWTQIDISDRGEGIPAGDLEHVFDKFFRVQRKLNTSGSGLGLAICKGIVEAHGGSIQACTREGGGTIITITVPREVEV